MLRLRMRVWYLKKNSVMASYSIEHTDLHVRMHGGDSHWLQA